MNLIDEPELPESVRRDIHDHEVLLSFNADEHAELFREWWNETGWKQFKAWANSGDDR